MHITPLKQGLAPVLDGIWSLLTKYRTGGLWWCCILGNFGPPTRVRFHHRMLEGARQVYRCKRRQRARARAHSRDDKGTGV